MIMFGGGLVFRLELPAKRLADIKMNIAKQYANLLDCFIMVILFSI